MTKDLDLETIALINKEKNEMAQMFRNVTLRMKLAAEMKQEFIFDREAADKWDRTNMAAAWVDLSLYNQGFDYDHVDSPFEEAA